MAHFRCRKNQSTLTATERSRFVQAVLALKASGRYDAFVQTHIDSMTGTNMWAHRRPGFLPWHRQYLLDYENELRAIDATVTLPYWDWTVDNSASSSIWNVDFMGGNGRALDGRVMTGPFAFDAGAWTLAVGGPDLRRRFGLSLASLPAALEVSAALGQADYDASPWDASSATGFRNWVEGWVPFGAPPNTHNAAHVWVGGSMLPESSPNDPVFFLHHCFIDKLWADWQAAHPGAGYVPVSGGPAGHNLNDAMEPWAAQGQTISAAAVLDHLALGYAYDTEGVCAAHTLKFRDDLPTIKFRDDFPTLKLLDDGATLKFRDDIPTLKATDDRPTLKIRDDLPTLKLRDDVGTMKLIDDGPGTLKPIDDGPGTMKAIDDVKTPALDFGSSSIDPLTQPQSFTGTSGTQAPFILATPHHSMAWAETFPDAFRATVQRVEQQIAQCCEAIIEHEQAGQSEHLSEVMQQELSGLRAELTSLIRELQSLTGG